LAEKKLKKNADLWLEIAEQRGDEMLALFNSNLFDCNLYKDLTGRNRYIHAKKKLGDK
jgi:methylase of polypeptide subunit release factors